MPNPTQKVPYYIIVSTKKNAIWQGTYDTKTEADKEYKTQFAQLSPSQQAKSDWQVETRFKFVKMSNQEFETHEKFDDF